MAGTAGTSSSATSPEQLIRETADAMVATGMKRCRLPVHQHRRLLARRARRARFIQVDAKRFPNGMKALADYIRNKGLKDRHLPDAGWKTCRRPPGSRGYEFQDAQTHAEWGIDYLKYDWCNTGGLNAEGAYQTMSAALRKAGRPIVFSLCERGQPGSPGSGARRVGHWRTTATSPPASSVVSHGDWRPGAWCRSSTCRRACANTPAQATGTANMLEVGKPHRQPGPRAPRSAHAGRR